MVHRIIETMYFLFEYLQQPNALRINQCSLHAISSSWAEVAYRYVAPTNVADRSMTGFDSRVHERRKPVRRARRWPVVAPTSRRSSEKDDTSSNARTRAESRKQKASMLGLE
jgi:hypothetical protein